ncbi:MAG: hypothetical protein GH155_07725 [Spirochaeta sp.]|nr:hypothetical protein [Spirochaeta sp.]
MIKISFLFIMLSLLFTLSCASTKLDNYQPEEPVFLYKTDFSTVNDRFKVESAGEIAEINGGVLHLKASSDNGEPAVMSLKVTFGNNSVTSFLLKLGADSEPDNPAAKLNFLTTAESRFSLILSLGNISYATKVEGKATVPVKPHNKRFRVNEWYDMVIALQDYSLTLFIDGKRSEMVKLSSKLPARGILIFECPQEYWIDDLQIMQVSTFARAK